MHILSKPLFLNISFRYGACSEVEGRQVNAPLKTRITLVEVGLRSSVMTAGMVTTEERNESRGEGSDAAKASAKSPKNAERVTGLRRW